MAIEQVQFTDERWLQFWENFKGLKHQREAVIKLGRQIKKADTGLLTGTAEWAEAFSNAPQPAAFRPSAPYSHRVTPNIQYGELALWSESRRFTAQHQCDTALLICQFIEKARAHFGGKPAIITSGYRPPKINAQVGGASRSEHLYDQPDTGAVDWYIDGVSVHILQNWARANWPYSTGLGASKGFVHTGIRPGRPKVVWDY
jgi:hypothetical protein